MLPVRVRSPRSGEKRREKTVLALIDTGAEVSIVSEQLAKELQLLPAYSKMVKNQIKEEIVELEIAAVAGGNSETDKKEESLEEEGRSSNGVHQRQFTTISCVLTSIEFGELNNRVPSSRLERLAGVLGIPPEQIVTPELPKDVIFGELLLGTDVIPRLLLPPRSSAPPARVIPLAANLTAIETPLGYLVQGSQLKPLREDSSTTTGKKQCSPYFVFNWQYCSSFSGTLSEWLSLSIGFVVPNFFAFYKIFVGNLAEK